MTKTTETPESPWWEQDDEEFLASLPVADRKCSNCYYWSGSPGNMPTDFICAVNVPRPSLDWLDQVDGRKAYALHDCPDYKTSKHLPQKTPPSIGACRSRKKTTGSALSLTFPGNF